ncbi:MAG: hypothetical protein ACEPO2_02775 [Pelagibaca sp.]
MCVGAGCKRKIWGVGEAKNSTIRFDNQTVLGLPEPETTTLASRAMKMQVNIRDGEVMISLDEGMVYVTPEVWKG